MSLGLALVTTRQVLGDMRSSSVLGLSTQLAQVLPATGSSFLPTTSGSEATILSPLFQVNIPAVFADAVTVASLVVQEQSVFEGQARFVNEVILENGAQLLGNLNANGIDIDVGSGEITASNLVYSVVAGGGITVSGDQDITITNADRGSDQKIFKSIKVGDDTASAGSNTDTFEFTAGSGVALSLNTSDKKLTVSADNLSGWYKASSSNVALITSSNRVGIGTSSPTNKLEVDSGTDGETGITFTRVTSSTAAGVGGGKVLSVDSGGKLILVEDQTGGGGAATPSAEAVLPSATNGMTLYFNGTNWVSSNNLYHDGGSVGISTTSPVSRFHVFTNLATKIGQIIQGYTGQTANLTEWRDASGSVLSYVDANGVFNGSANVAGSLNPGLTSGSVLFQGASGITQDNANFFWDDTNKRLGIGGTTPQSKLMINGAGSASAPGTAFLTLNNTHATSFDEIGINFTNRNNGAGSGNFVGSARINSYLDSGGDTAQLRFYTGGATPSVRMIINGINGLVGIGTTSPTALLHVNGGYGANDAFTVNQTLGGNILSASASGTTRMVLTNAGNLGIGTATPAEKLIVQGNIFANGGGGNRIGVKRDGSYDVYLSTTNGDTSSLHTMNGFWIENQGNLKMLHYSVNDPQPIITLNYDAQNYDTRVLGQSSAILYYGDASTGNVGIGTATPDTKFEVVGVSSTRWAQFKNADGVSGVNFRPGASSGTTYSNIQAFSGLGAANLILNEFGGNIGIGTTVPTYKVDITGNLRATTSITSGGGIYNSGIYYIGGVNYSAMTLSGSALSLGYENTSLALRTSSTTQLLINASGLVGIGTTTPTALLHINGGYGANDALTINQTLSGNILSASASGTTKMVLSNSGQLGIGTTAPTSDIYIWDASVADIYVKSNNTGTGLYMDGGAGAGNGITFKAANVQKWAIFDRENFAGTPLTIQDNSNNIVTAWLDIGASGLMGINNSAPTAALHVDGKYGSNAAAIINQTNAGDILTASASGTTKLVLANSGRMGLGLGTPGFMLDILATADNIDNGAALALKGTSYTTHGGYLILNKNTGNNTAAIIQSGDNNQYTPILLNPSGGNVGVGTTSTSYKLDVNGTARVAELLRVTGANGGVQMDSRDGSGTNFQWYNNTGDDLRLYGSSDLFTFTGTGRLGIGETSPQASLHVGPNNDGHVRHSAGTIDVRWDFVSRVYLSQNLGVDTGLGYNSGGIRISGQAIGEYGYILGGRTAAGGSGYDILFNPNNAGNIGIGTYVPGARLQVSGNGTTTGGALNITDSGGNSGLYVQDRGNIGMGTTSPIHRLQLTGTQTGKALAVLNETGTNDILTASSSGTTRFVLRESGRIGINTSNPEGFTHIRRTATNRAYTLDGNDTLVLEHFDTNRLKWVSNNTAHQLLSFSDEDSEDMGVIAYHHDTDSMGFATNTVTALRIDSAQNVGLLPTLAFGTNASRVFAIASSTAPTTSITDGIQLFAVDVAGSHELQVRDEAGNVTTLSPHNFSLLDNQRSEDLAWAFYSERNGLAINADMTKALRVVEKLSGEKLVRIKNLTNGEDLTDFYADQSTHELALDNAEWVARAELNPFMTWGSDVLTIIGKTIFEKPAEFLADVTVRGRLYLSDKDAAGYAVIKAGATTVTVPFEHSFITPPVVTVTAQKAVSGLRVTQTTQDSFTIQIAEPLTEDVTINWVAVAVTDPRVVESVAGSSIELETSVTSPTPNPSASLAPTSSPTPSPTIDPTPTPTPSQEVSPVPTPTPSTTESIPLEP